MMQHSACMDFTCDFIYDFEQVCPLFGSGSLFRDRAQFRF